METEKLEIFILHHIYNFDVESSLYLIAFYSFKIYLVCSMQVYVLFRFHILFAGIGSLYCKILIATTQH